MVQKTGDDLQDFFDFYESNKDRKEKCFLVQLGTEDANATASQISIYENGKVETTDFILPEKLFIKGIKDYVRGWDSYNMTIHWEEANTFVTHCVVEMTFLIAKPGDDGNKTEEVTEKNAEEKAGEKPGQKAGESV